MLKHVIISSLLNTSSPPFPASSRNPKREETPILIAVYAVPRNEKCPPYVVENLSTD